MPLDNEPTRNTTHQISSKFINHEVTSEGREVLMTAHQKTPISAISILTAIFHANLRHYSSAFTFFLQLSLKKTFGDKMYKYFEGCMHVIRPTGQKRRRKLRALTTKRKSHPLAPTFPIYPKAPDSRGLAYCYPTPMPILKKSTTITTHQK